MEQVGLSRATLEFPFRLSFYSDQSLVIYGVTHAFPILSKYFLANLDFRNFFCQLRWQNLSLFSPLNCILRSKTLFWGIFCTFKQFHPCRLAQLYICILAYLHMYTSILAYLHTYIFVYMPFCICKQEVIQAPKTG